MSNEDPELELNNERDAALDIKRMKDMAREASEDLIPILMEKAVNGKSKDALAIFESLADRSGFHKPPQASQQQGVPQINFNISAEDMGGMLAGLKTITQAAQPAEPPMENVTPQTGHPVQFVPEDAPTDPAV